MSVAEIRRALTAAKRNGGAVDPAEIDRIMIKARDVGGLSDSELVELQLHSSEFSDATQQRLLTHVSAMRQKHAWVNVQLPGEVATIEGRTATMKLSIPGLSARVGLFDNVVSLTGTATKAGSFEVSVAGKKVKLAVKAGETAASVLQQLSKKLPADLEGAVMSGAVKPFESVRYDEKDAKKSETSAHIALYKPSSLGLRPNEKPLRVMVTGYGEFMGITDNPSAAMAQKLATLGVPGALVEYRRLEVTPDAVDEFMKEMKANPPDVILSMGVGGRAQVEERPENRLGQSTDGHDQPIVGRAVRVGTPAELHTDLPVQTIDWATKPFAENRQVFTSVGDPNYSPDRSAYLCNYLGYNLALEFGQSATTAGFMHVTDSTPVEQMHAVLKAITAKQLDDRRAGNATPRS